VLFYLLLNLADFHCGCDRFICCAFFVCFHKLSRVYTFRCAGCAKIVKLCTVFFFILKYILDKLRS
jgi:hypothetical protein